MRTLFILAIGIAAAFLAGWFNVQRDEQGTTITTNRDEIRKDAGRAVARVKEFLDKDESTEPGGSPYRQAGYEQRPQAGQVSDGYDADGSYPNGSFDQGSYGQPRHDQPAYDAPGSDTWPTTRGGYTPPSTRGPADEFRGQPGGYRQ